MTKNLFEKFSRFDKQQKRVKKNKYDWDLLEKLIDKFQLARDINDLQLQDYYYWEISKIVHGFLMNNHILKYNWWNIYPDYDKDFFWMFDYQFLRRISDYWQELKKNWEISKKQIHKIEEQKKNYYSMIICLSKYVHENLIYWYTEKKFSFLDVRSMMKKKSNIENISMHYGEWSENLADYQTKYQENTVSNKVNSNYIMWEVVNHLEQFLSTISKTDHSQLFKTFSKDALMWELETGVFSTSWKRVLKRIADKFPKVQEYFADLSKKTI